ncbi:PREDICTED: GDSL esterase/lipase At2g19010 [Camelina sativa]|uniref:GDSL esterase/lipase At2g19010 n=1 Tax=Camelina sativa TaxID=90675 RepID=A0ABM0XSJ8_CAMSA|nr:PREDICTED: GDSL esterase/lipase At2g19010 [Camelina sativa]
MVKGMSKAFWLVAAIVSSAATVVYGQQVPCFFIFGDSLSDNGNNNNLKSKAKVNYSPYGIDFPNGPTGRFTNGRTIPDIIGELSGFKDFIPSFANSSPNQAHTGINYASGGGGLREETSQHLGGRISLRKQIQNHKRAIKKVNVPSEKLQQCLYAINIGSNDYINNYFMSKPYNSKRRYTPKQYAYSLIIIYRSHLKNLHRLGARKVALFGLSQIGCTPKMMKSHSDGKSCSREVNEAVKIFNMNLDDLVMDFNKKVKGSKFTFVDLFSGGDPLAYTFLGFKVGHKGCCTVTPGDELCVPNRPVCANRTEYVFWDDLHSSEATNMVVAKGSFDGLLTKPYSIAQLVKE